MKIFSQNVIIISVTPNTKIFVLSDPTQGTKCMQCNKDLRDDRLLYTFKKHFGLFYLLNLALSGMTYWMIY